MYVCLCVVEVRGLVGGIRAVTHVTVVLYQTLISCLRMKLQLMDPVFTKDAIVHSYQYQLCQSHTNAVLEMKAHKKTSERRTLVCCVEI